MRNERQIRTHIQRFAATPLLTAFCAADNTPILADLPVFPHMALPDGYTPDSVATQIIGAFARNGVSGVFALANSWPLDLDPAYARILDDWVAAGHHIGSVANP